MFDLMSHLWRHVCDRPECAAIVYPSDKATSYRDLWDDACSISHSLRSAGASFGSVVALATQRSPRSVASVMAIHGAGAACMPLDLTLPAERLQYMIRASAAEVLLADDVGLTKIHSPTDVAIVPLAQTLPVTGNRVDMRYVSADQLCYIMFTSGSTGRPKGVAVEHRLLSNLVAWETEQPYADPSGRTLQFAPLSFDVAFQEIFSTLATGGTLVYVNDAHRTDPVALWEHIIQMQVTRIYVPFVMLSALAICAPMADLRKSRLRWIITAGEQLQCTDEIKAMFKDLPGCRLINQYGPTETHAATSYLLPTEPRSWPTLPPIGKPMANASVLVIDQRGVPISDGGGVGEIYIGGPTLSRGYVADSGRTAERFVKVEKASNMRMFRTGDLGSLDNGLLFFHGRMDDQLKVQGYRVEPAEVEAALCSHPSIQQAAVVSVGYDALSRMLVGYLVGTVREAEFNDIKNFLKDKLPNYMVPSRFVSKIRLPLTANGKVDRKALHAEAMRAE